MVQSEITHDTIEVPKQTEPIKGQSETSHDTIEVPEQTKLIKVQSETTNDKIKVSEQTEPIIVQSETIHDRTEVPEQTKPIKVHSETSHDTIEVPEQTKLIKVQSETTNDKIEVSEQTEPIIVQSETIHDKTEVPEQTKPIKVHSETSYNTIEVPESNKLHTGETHKKTDTSIVQKDFVIIDASIDLKTIDDVVDSDTCDLIAKYVTKHMVDSTITSDEHDFRKSKTSVLDINEPLIHVMNKRICDIMKVDISKGEPMQGIHYQDGGYFKPHTDYFETSELHICGKSGNREMSAILYLNDIPYKCGGELHFPLLNKTIVPKKGMLVMWMNMKNGRSMYTSINEDKVITGGHKTTLVKYIRERQFI
jgi:hypothetical protein